MPTLTDFAFQFGDTGITLNTDPLPDGTILDINDVQGLDMSFIKSSTISYDGRPGGLIHAKHDDIRKIVIAGTLIAGSIPIMQTLEALKANFALGDTPQSLYFQAPGVGQRQVFCKSGGVTYSWNQAMRSGSTPISFTLFAEDPKIYGVTLNMVTGQLAPPFPGYGWNRPWPYSFGGGGIVGHTLLTNNGTRPAGFKAIIQNQVVGNPRFLSDTTGKLVSTTNLGVGSTDTLIFDFYNQTVILNGLTRHAALASEGWFDLQPGVNSIRFQADSTNNATVQYQYYDTYW